MRKIDLLQTPRFGHLVVGAEAGADERGRTLWLCQCDCGRTAVVRGDNLRSGKTTSCGCQRVGRPSLADKPGIVARFYINVWAGQDALAAAGPASYSLAHMTDADGKTLLVSTLALRMRRGSPHHPAVTRGMNMLRDAGFIGPQGAMSFNNWMRFHGVAMKVMDYQMNEDVEDRFFELTGKKQGHLLPKPSVDTRIFPVMTEEQRAAEARTDEWLARAIAQEQAAQQLSKPPILDYRLKTRGQQLYLVPPVGGAFTGNIRAKLLEWLRNAGYFASATGPHEIAVSATDSSPALDFIVDGVREQKIGRQVEKELSAPDPVDRSDEPD